MATTSKRDIINEINSIKSRSRFGNRDEYSRRFYNIIFAFEKINMDLEQNTELLKYIPIVSVACIEGFFRVVYRDLIDFGNPYKKNAITFNQAKNIKFDFEIINALQSKSLSAGDFIGHILPCNNLDDINSNVSTIMGLDFISELKSFEPKTIFDHIVHNSASFRQNSSQILKDIVRTFELRHIFCHEFSVDYQVNQEEILRCFKNVWIFMDHADDFVYRTLYPNPPETTADMTNDAGEQYEKADAELSELLTTIKETWLKKGDQYNLCSLLDKSMDHWKKYRDSRVRINTVGWDGGNMQPQIHCMEMTSVTREKIESLKREYHYMLEKKNRDDTI